MATALLEGYLLPRRKRGLRKGVREQLDKLAELIVLNLFSAWFQNDERWVFYPRDKQWIDSRTPYSSKLFLEIVDGLPPNLLASVKGERGAGLWDPERSQPMRSRIKVEQTLVEMFGCFGLKSWMIRTSECFDSIRLCDENKKRIRIPADCTSQPKIAELKYNVTKINEVIQNTFIGLRVTNAQLEDINRRLSDDPHSVPVNMFKKTLFRVFNNGNFGEGGRFCGGWWQDIPSEWRPFIHMSTPRNVRSDREPLFTKEVDFQSMFPAIAYGKLGQTIDDTAYHLDGKEQNKEIRKVIKLCLLIMFSAESSRSARSAAHRELAKTKRKKQQNGTKQTGNMKESDFLPKGCPRLFELIKQLEKDHEQLFREGYLYNKVRFRELMKIESEIAEAVMLHFALQHDVAVLPIHDSFIVPKSYAGGPGPGLLDDVMKKKFEEIVGVQCLVSFDRDYREFVQPQSNSIILNSGSEWNMAELFGNEERERASSKIYYKHVDDWYGN